MRILQTLKSSACAMAIICASASLAFAANEINILTWEGYADQSFVKPFEDASGCKVNATYVGSNDDFAPKLIAGGGVYDLISPSIDSTTTLIEAAFLQPVDTSKLAEYNNLYEQFRTNAAFNHEGEVYGIPFAWGAIAFMYLTDKFETPPTSLADLWDEKYAGKISLWDDKSALYVAARLIGAKDIYNLTDEEMAATKAKLIEQKPLIRKYWATAGELVDLYASGEVWISNTWAGYQSGLLKEKGINVTEFLPKEKAEGWIDSFLIVKDSPNLECTYKFLNMLIAEEGQCGVANVNGYSVANPVAAKKCMTPEQFKALHQDDLAYLDELVLWKNLGADIERYTNTWNAVKAQ
ncbi:MAG: ABC transporter substrate-binding protein [Alphaproteobacteria bacterium]|nr:ABC transporter substrate-binding protein [Alphaproteobacteria bacterium]